MTEFTYNEQISPIRGLKIQEGTGDFFGLVRLIDSYGNTIVITSYEVDMLVELKKKQLEQCGKELQERKDLVKKLLSKEVA